MSTYVVIHHFFTPSSGGGYDDRLLVGRVEAEGFAEAASKLGLSVIQQDEGYARLSLPTYMNADRRESLELQPLPLLGNATDLHQAVLGH